jgi:CheY-like chemotaxis protein
MTAIDEQEALQIAGTSWQPDIVLLNLRPPEVEVFPVFERFRATNQSVAIFVLGRDSDEDEIRNLEAGADDYLAKPCSPKVLLARLRAHLRSGLGHRETADNGVWRPPAGHEKLRDLGEGRVGGSATPGITAAGSRGAVNMAPTKNGLFEGQRRGGTLHSLCTTRIVTLLG